MNEENIFLGITGILILLIVFTGLPKVLLDLLKKAIWLGAVFTVLYFIDAFFLP